MLHWPMLNDLELGTVTVGQNLTVTASGALTDSGAITVGSTTTIVSWRSSSNSRG